MKETILQAQFKTMVLIRRFEEKCAELYSAGKIRGFLHLYIGEEAIAAGVMPHLQQQDKIVATYREHGHALARGVPATQIMAEMYGKQQGLCRGRGGSMHLFDRSRSFYGGNAIVAGGLPIAVGLALAAKRLQQNSVIACFFGEGAMAEGEYHEAMNLASLWQLPVLFICENNGYAMGVPLVLSEAQTDLCVSARSYKMPAESVDGMDVLAVDQAFQRLTAVVRQSQSPCFVECRTYRFRAHSMFDAELYRSKDEVERWRQRDPIVTFKQTCLQTGMMSLETWNSLEAAAESEAAAEIAAAVAFAEAGSWEAVSDLEKHIYWQGGEELA